MEMGKTYIRSTKTVMFRVDINLEDRAEPTMHSSRFHTVPTVQCERQRDFIWK